MLHRRGVSRAEPVTATVLRAPQLHGDVFLTSIDVEDTADGSRRFLAGVGVARLHRGAAAVVMADGGVGLVRAAGCTTPPASSFFTATVKLITRTSFLGRASASRLMPTARARDGHTTWRWPATVPVRPPGSRDSGPPAAAPARPATGRAPPAPDRAREGNSQRSQRLGRQPHSIPRVTARGKEPREH